MYNENWGIKPILFEIGGFKVTSYAVFMMLALLSGFLVYLYSLKKDNIKSSNSIYIAIFALTFGTIGAKIPIIFIYWDEIVNSNSAIELLSGRTIVGGLIGGFLGTFLAKKIFNIKEKMGNQLAIPVAIGMAIGRIGCFFTGCCYGVEAYLPWGVNFGDGILRHPTQIYEIIFDLLLVVYLVYRKKFGVKPGELFKIFLSCYMSFRFIIEFIRTEKVVFVGLTAFQLLCILTLVYINREYILKTFKNNKLRRGFYE